MFWIVIAAAASVITAVQLIPQTLKALKAKELKSISLTTFLTISLTASLWILHGIHNKDNAIVFANTITLICALTISLLKLRKN